MVLSIVTVRYSFKNECGYLVDASRVFMTHKDAIDFVNGLKRFRLIGKVVLDIGSGR